MRFLSGADVAGDFGGADDRSRLRLDRGDAEGNVDPLSILVYANRLVVIDLLAVFDFGKIPRTSSRNSSGNDDVDPLADRFLRRESEKALGGLIPARDDASRFLVTIASLEDSTAAMNSCSRSAYSRIAASALRDFGDVFERGDPAAACHRPIGHPKDFADLATP